MQLGLTAQLQGIAPVSWLWSKWLKLNVRSNLQYEHFTHFEFMEDESKRSEVKDTLANLLYNYHSFSPVNTNLLAQLKYRRLASVLSRNNDRRPRTDKTRSGNLIEILACEFAKKQGYEIPVLRLQYNPNSNESMKGDDILGFHFASGKRGQDAFLLGEGKFRSRFANEAIEEAYSDLTRKTRSYPVSMEFVSTILALEGDEVKAARVRQLRQRISSQPNKVPYEHLLFLGTIGQPLNPFEYLANRGNGILPNLTAVNIVFKNDFRIWINEVYEKEDWT